MVSTGSGIDRSAIRELRRRVDGAVIAPDDDAYGTIRQVWNGMIDRRPAAILQPRTPEAVAAAIAFGREHGLEIAVRGGGHNVAGASTVEDGLVIDLRAIDRVEVDPRRRRATVGGGATLGQLDDATAPHGLATTAGTVSHTGVGGLTLGGGYGLLARVHGLACDNLVGATVVTASGDVVRATETENADLLWGLRGGGGNFGVVTAFEFLLHDLPPTVAGGTWIFSFDEAVTVLGRLLDAAPGLPDRLLMTAAVLLARTEHHVPDELVGQPVAAVSWDYLGDPDEGRRLAETVRDGRPAVLEVPGEPERGYLAWQHDADEANRPGQRVYWKGSFAVDMPRAGIEALLTRGAPPDTTSTAGVGLFQLGGAIGRVPEDATAFGHREAQFDLLAISRWTDPAEDAVRIADVRRAWTAVLPYVLEGSYVNSLADDSDDRVRASYGEAKYARLQALKDRYDPDNVFRRNANIRPTAADALPVADAG